MLEDINQEASERMQKSITAFRTNLSKIRTGRATPEYYKKEKVGTLIE